jgi:hypothetical protein
MFDITWLVVGVIAGMIVAKFFGRSDEDIEDEQDAAATIARIEAIKVELENINGVWYCWMHDVQDGWCFVGQNETKEKMEEDFMAFARKKYHTS